MRRISLARPVLRNLVEACRGGDRFCCFRNILGQLRRTAAPGVGTQQIPYERAALFVFLVARLFAHQDYPGVYRTFSRHGLCRATVQIAPAAILQRGLQRPQPDMRGQKLTSSDKSRRRHSSDPRESQCLTGGVRAGRALTPTSIGRCRGKSGASLHYECRQALQI